MRVLVIAGFDKFVTKIVAAIKNIPVVDSILLLHPTDQISYSASLLADIIFLDLKSIGSEAEYSDTISGLSSMYHVHTLIVIISEFDPFILKRLKEYGAAGYIHRGMSEPYIFDNIFAMLILRKLFRYPTD